MSDVSSKTINSPNWYRRLRVRFCEADGDFLYVYVQNELLKVRYQTSNFDGSLIDETSFWGEGASLNLLGVTIDDLGVLNPSFVVFEPDYLIDISSLAECFRDYGSHPLNYFMSRLMPIQNARPLLLGNIANLFLDEWIHAGEQEPDYNEVMRKAFRQYPVELAGCEDLHDSIKEKEFFADCRMHFNHIREIVQHTFMDSLYQLDKSDAVLEPSYICEALGLQGRLDYMQRDMSSFIEMKSGKANEYAVKGRIIPRENNLVQMLLYMAVLEYNEDTIHTKTKPYLLYTRYPMLYPACVSQAQVKRVIDLRNQIVAMEYGTQLHNNCHYTENLLSQINPEVLNQKRLRGRFWEQYLAPSIRSFQNQLSSLGSLERKYFYTVYNFITKELYLSKTGRMDDGKRIGIASMWLDSLQDKLEAGEILCDLKIKENHASLPHKAYVVLTLPVYADDFQPNFRNGDMVVLYERNTDKENVSNRMVFKGTLEEINASELRIRLRAPQRNPSLFPSDSLYAVEHDSMDTSFRTMFAGLYAFMTANKERRDLLLGRRLPCFSEPHYDEDSQTIDDFTRITHKAERAKDFFLLVGPPGTGKTSKALNQMVRAFNQKGDHILLLAYTNRAVDEICSSITRIVPALDYIRIGGELTCDIRYREHLLENILEPCKKRSEVLKRMSSCRIYVGTIASVASKPELFQIKRFDVAIIDEATQVLEPQLLGILCAKVKDGRNAIGKFILIGDHKQLPAVVQQDSCFSEVQSEELRAIGLLNLKDSLFERLYRSHFHKQSLAVDMLCKQGRMHPNVAKFPNEAFYGGKLEAVGLPHQQEVKENGIAFIASSVDKDSKSFKTNRMEAFLVADVAVSVWEKYKDEFDTGYTLGIITPYRSQIALIKKELEKRNIDDLKSITVDTVERYQGSERDIVIYSFCVNNESQLQTLPNLTEENGVVIDRKLNVVLTRARKQTIIIGNPTLLKLNPIYCRLLDSIL